ncbi:hypothetical protein SLEP1_g59140 [Rubroshorea leprosula]|uniref:RanBD1 domain-containing protein n=1 Tax=Rubroshorea leprosula TaxID=152421 RepID=A0AAV5MUP4_9ROSI|nr:hypothetical protein SLEP1_g59140 [Rubroshorea leprosula]
MSSTGAARVAPMGDEVPILDMKSKLYRFDKDGNQWKERGAGTVKLLKHMETSKVRLVMRQSKTFKICANHHVLPTMTVQEYDGNDKSCVWHATDFADGELKDEFFCIRFTSVKYCKDFMKIFQEVAESQKNREEQEVAESQKNREENKDVTAAAGLFEKLSLEEKKTEDKDAKDDVKAYFGSCFGQGQLWSSMSSLGVKKIGALLGPCLFPKTQ